MQNPQSRPQNSTELARLDVNDPLAFVKARAAKGKPPMFEFGSEGDNVAGYVTEVETVEGIYGPFDVISLLEEDGAECRVQATGAVLSRRLASVNVGDAVGIRRIEDGYSVEHKKSYPLYDVTVAHVGALRGALAPSPTSPKALQMAPEVARIVEDLGGELTDDDAPDDEDF